MSDVTPVNQVDQLLKQLAEGFLTDLKEQCDRAESYLLALEKRFELDAFNRLFGLVHSIKGSGGTHGFAIITSIGHQFESALIEWQKAPRQDALPILLGFVDLLRQASDSLSDNEETAHLKQQLENLRLNAGQSAKRILLVESSRIMRQLCQQVLEDLSLQVDSYDDGLTALSELLHTRYDVLIIGRQLNSLNGPAVVAALRESDSPNHHLPVLMLSADQSQLPVHLGVLKLLPRTPKLSDVLQIELEKLIHKRPCDEGGKFA